MRFLVLFLIAIIIVGGLVIFYYYNEEYKPAIEKYGDLLDENKTLAKYLSELRFEAEDIQPEIKNDTLMNMFPQTETSPVYEKNITGIKLTLPVGNLFDPGGYKLNEKGRGLIRKIAEIISRIENTDIIIEGHTDNEEIGPTLKKTIQSNWELSSLRAINVVKFLQDSVKISPEKLSAVAYGETRPIESNETEFGKKKNRRIEIFLRYKDFAPNKEIIKKLIPVDSIPADSLINE